MVAFRLVLAAVALAGAAPASAELDLSRAEVAHLPSGLTVIMLEDRSFPVVSVQVLYKTGSAAETAGKTGLAHFVEHLVFRGSENFPGAAATEAVYDMGGEWHGYTALDQTAYFETVPREALDKLLRIHADRMTRTIIDPSSIEAEKGAVITELHSYENDPASVLLDAATSVAIAAHPYRNPMAGYVSDVRQLTAEDARAFYANHYAPGNAVLTIVGDFAAAQAREAVSKAFASIAQRPAAKRIATLEPAQSGERRVRIRRPVDRQSFVIAFGSPAASSVDLPAFLVLQQILSGGGGVNPRQSDWGSTPAAEGSLLSGATADIASALLPTQDPFLFTVSGSIALGADTGALERDVDERIGLMRSEPPSADRLEAAQRAVTQALADDVQTTEDAAHQLAFFEGIGAFDVLIDLPRQVAAVTPSDVQRVARTYLAPERRTVAWLVGGEPAASPTGAGNPHPAADRAGAPPVTGPVREPELRRLSAGLPAIVQWSPLSDSAAVALLLSAPVEGGSRPADFPGLDVIFRSGRPDDLTTLIAQTRTAVPAVRERPSADPATRLEQLISARMGRHRTDSPRPVGVVVSGKVDPDQTFAILERQLGGTVPAATAPIPAPSSDRMRVIRERIARPLAQGTIGYVVEGPQAGSRQALVWRMLLYVLSHDYSGRLGRSAISDKGLVYHIHASQRTDGVRTWTTISTGVDPDKADAMEAELRAQLARLAKDPPSASEAEAARRHLLGRDLTSAQSNEELISKLTRQFVETGGLQSHEQFREELEAITPAELARAARAFSTGTIIRVDVDGR